MPQYGQSPWLDASEQIGGGIQNMNGIALQMARMKYMQAVQQQRQAILLGQMAMKQHLNDAQIARDTAAGTNSLAQARAAGAKEKMTMAQIGSADRLGDQVWRKNMPEVSPDINVPIPANDPGMARIAGEQARVMALHGKTVPLHNVPPGNNTIDPQGTLVGIGQNEVKFQPAGTIPYDASAQAPVGSQSAFRPSASSQRPFLHNVNPGQIVIDKDGNVISTGTPKIGFAPSGTTPYSLSGTNAGSPLGPQTPFRPSTPRTSDLDGQFLRIIGARMNSIERASNPYDKNSLGGNQEYQWLKPQYSNMVNRVQAKLAGTNDVSQGASQPRIGAAGKQLDPATAKGFLDQAGGDKDAARKLALDAGYSF